MSIVVIDFPCFINTVLGIKKENSYQRETEVSLTLNINFKAHKNFTSVVLYVHSQEKYVFVIELNEHPKQSTGKTCSF